MTDSMNPLFVGFLIFGQMLIHDLGNLRRRVLKTPVAGSSLKRLKAFSYRAMRGVKIETGNAVAGGIGNFDSTRG